MNTIKKRTFIAAAVLFSPLALFAQSADATSSDAAQQASNGDGIKIDLSKKASITVSVYAQAQYYFADSKNNANDTYSGFSIRRAAISVKGKIDENWSAEVGFEIDGGKNGDKLDGAFVDKAVIAYKTKAGKLTAGYQKTAFVMEEYSSSKTQLAIEQSIASRYFTQASPFKQLTGRHGGIWWDGEVKFDSNNALKYTAALTNQYKEDFNSDDNAGVAFYGNVAYALKTDDDLALEIGINAAINPGNDKKDDTGKFRADNAPHGLVYGFEPYAKITSGGFTGIFEGIFSDGDSDAGIKDSAWGLNATAAYRFESDIEPVVRLAYIDVGDNKNLKPDMLQNTPAGTSDHDSALGVYLGANFYANKNIKISAGYEFTDFNGGEKSEYANALRLQLQAVF